MYEQKSIRFHTTKGTIDAAMETKEIVKEGLAAGESIALVNFIRLRRFCYSVVAGDTEETKSLRLPQKRIRTDKELFYPAHSDFVN
jgi:hypothetical protein